jgi:threonylcarbamoyladenosine tRNA methylthiotransferase MtaB
MGCYSQIKPDNVSNIDGVDIIIGNTNKSRIVEIVEDYIKNKRAINLVENIKKVDFEDMKLDSFETKTRAFIKIQDGCNNYCSYCIIPYARGDIRSKEKDKVLNEAYNLVNNGYKEIVLTGIHTGHYGKDNYNYDISDLLSDLCNIEKLKRIRISSIEITELDNKFMKILSNNKIVNHLHIPLQSGCNKTLKEMNRKYDTNYFINKIKEIRKIKPDISITTDVIVGFPNETEEDFNETYNFIKEVSFSKLHVFPFSKRDGTKAAIMKNQVTEEIKKDRVKKLIQLSKELEIKYMNNFIDRNLEVLVEGYKDNIIEGHSTNYLLVKATGTNDEVNKIINVKISKIIYPYLYGDKI